jgi:ceramide glucosyltransferase
MSPLTLVAMIGLVLCVAVYAAAAIALIRALRRARGSPIAGWEPPVSILKPLCGVDEDLAWNLESFFRLDYGVYEVIFSFASVDDPA